MSGEHSYVDLWTLSILHDSPSDPNKDIKNLNVKSHDSFKLTWLETNEARNQYGSNSISFQSNRGGIGVLI